MFSFVDQITAVAGGSVRGRFAVPEHFEGAPDWLVIEAIGQLAAWEAMRESDFTKRPVGATVGGLEFLGQRRRRGVIELSATIERTDRRAILYRGEASCEGIPVATMWRCIGPLLPMEAFEDPEHAKARFVALMGPDPLRLWTEEDPLPRACTSDLEERDGEFVSEFRVEADAAFFDEHFPRQPVVPATLLIESMCRIGAASVAAALGASRVPAFEKVEQVKVRQFTQPGQTLLIRSRPSPPTAEVSAHNGSEGVATVRVTCSS